MHDDSHPVSELREALNAVRDNGSVREALDAVNGTAPGPAADDFSWSASRPVRQWPRRLGRALTQMNTWTLILTAAGAIATVAGAVIAYPAWVKPH